MILQYIEHVFPSPVNPALQAHAYDPTVYIATQRINVTAVRVGRTLVEICIRIVSYIKR